LGREAIGRWSRDRKVLNLFSYTGSISVYAAAGGAREIVAVDVAAKAHARARRNFAINNFDPEKPEHLAGDGFGLLEKFKQRNRRFDMVVIDPPAFASAPKGGKPWSAVGDYGELVAACLDVTEPGGVLVAASSTRKLSRDDFHGALADGAARAATQLRIVERVGLPPDFPISVGFPEADYLKFAVAVRD
jgi:23S rRNA (cytosine1962-C5)-methyltransferase